MKIFIGYIVLFFASMVVFAEGEMRGQPDLGVITTGDGCAFAVPQSIDTENCEVLFQDHQSGVTTWVCEDQTYIATCPSVGEEPPGNSGNNPPGQSR